MAEVPQLPDAGGSSISAPQKVRNWAEDAAVRERIKSEIVPMLQTIRMRRKPLTDMWHRLRRVWTLEHDEQHYRGDSNIYVPAGKKLLETIVAQLVTATFPGEDNFTVEATREFFAKTAENEKLVLQHQIERVAKVRLAAERFYRQLGITGNSPVKFHYKRKQVVSKQRSTKRFAGVFGLPTDTPYTMYDGPVFETLDISNFYAWPEDVDELSDAEIVFEDMTVSVASLKQRAMKGLYYEPEVDLASTSSRLADKDFNDVEKLRAQGFSSPKDANNSPSGWGVADVTEVYVDFDPAAVDRGSEKTPVPFLITVSAGGAVLRAIENPFWHKLPPYALGRMGTMVGRLYGTGLFEGIEQLNKMLNDQVNQAMDCAQYVLNPIVLSDPNRILGTLSPIEPGVQWSVNDVERAVKFDRPPVELIQMGSILTTQTSSWLNDYGGAPPVLMGGSSPGRAFKTATGVGTAQQNAKIPLQEIVRLCESQVWEPMCFFFHALTQQFAEDDVLVQITGDMNYKRFSRDELAGEFQFRWLASSQAANQTAKAGQITQLLQVLGSPGVSQLLQQNGKQIDPTPLIRKLYEEGFGFRDFNLVVKDMPPQVPGPPGQPPQPGGPPPPPPSNAPGPTAANSMALQQDMGDNSEFQGMRIGANSMAGAMGGMNNMPGPDEEMPQ